MIPGAQQPGIPPSGGKPILDPRQGDTSVSIHLSGAEELQDKNNIYIYIYGI